LELPELALFEPNNPYYKIHGCKNSYSYWLSTSRLNERMFKQKKQKDLNLRSS